MPNSKSSESVNQVRPKSFHQQSKANKTIQTARDIFLCLK